MNVTVTLTLAVATTTTTTTLQDLLSPHWVKQNCQQLLLMS